ncbi:hypothetical protein RB195_012965 [Necator americanus]|uniref:Uncharacterized protein n=1 Tax=Necator americanus TaxID=51031 RepID=A0ABR1DUK2_NECAM
METNQTLLDDVVISDDFPEPSTSTVMEDFPTARDLLIGDLPEMDPHNITAVSVNTTSTTHQIFENFFSVIESMMEENTWLIYTITGIVTVIVIIVIVAIVVWLIKHKKRVIQQENDPILTSTYDDGRKFGKCCFCCRKAPDKQSDSRIRQNSASNLDPYRRRPLPPIGTKASESYISTFNRNEALDGLSRPPPIDEKTLAVNIQSIRGVPHVDLRPDQYRNLPSLRITNE